MTCRHPIPKLRTPWWEWCTKCYGDAVATMTRPDPRELADLPARERCIFCMTVQAYGPARRFAKHADAGERCRGSGLAGYTSLALLEGIASATPLVEFAQRMRHCHGTYVPPADRTANHRAPAQITNDIISQLVTRRASLGGTQGDLAAALGVKKWSVCEWEKTVASPSLSRTIEWANLLGYDLALAHADGERTYRFTEIGLANRVLFAERKRRNLAQATLASLIGLSKERPESEELDLKLDSFAEWASALDFELELVNNG